MTVKSFTTLGLGDGLAPAFFKHRQGTLKISVSLTSVVVDQILIKKPFSGFSSRKFSSSALLSLILLLARECLQYLKTLIRDSFLV